MFSMDIHIKMCRTLRSLYFWIPSAFNGVLQGGITGFVDVYKKNKIKKKYWYDEKRKCLLGLKGFPWISFSSIQA